MTRRERARARLREAVFGIDRAEAAAHIGHAMARTLAAFGGVRPETEYDRHRARWIATGDETELYRMLRHVEVP